jgi:hypothetical protein
LAPKAVVSEARGDRLVDLLHALGGGAQRLTELEQRGLDLVGTRVPLLLGSVARLARRALLPEYVPIAVDTSAMAPKLYVMGMSVIVIFASRLGVDVSRAGPR